MKIFYLCDGNVPTCKKNTCYKNGGICDKTTDIAHAINFESRGKVGNYQEKNCTEQASAEITKERNDLKN